MVAPTQRLYLENGNKNPAINSTELNVNLQALFANWVRAGYHERDFIEAAAHVAGVIFAEYLIMGGPDLKDEVLTDVTITKKKDARVPGQSKPRFYNQDGDIESGFDVEDMRKVFATRFVEWVNRGYHGRDFMQAVHDESTSVYYDYDICRDFAGLGGGKTAEEYLDAPFASM